MCDSRFPDQHMHSLSHLLYHFLVGVAFMVKTYAPAQIAVQIVPSCHWSASEYRKAVFKCLCDCPQGILILFLEELSYRLPNAETFRPFLDFLMNFFCKIKRDR